MILAAAGSIAITVVRRLIDPTPVEQLGVGLAVLVVAAAVNGSGRAGAPPGREIAPVDYVAGPDACHPAHRRLDLGRCAVSGVGLVVVTGWEWLDPLVALGVAANIVVAGIVLIRRSVQGLLTCPPDGSAAVQRVLTGHANDSVRFHELRSDARADADSCRSTCSYRAT